MLHAEPLDTQRFKLTENGAYVGMLFPMLGRWGYKLYDGYEGTAQTEFEARSHIQERLRRTRG
ncbi:hypothetical protein [Salibacterium lacus]|uniref:Transcriptional regulator n=1 Tax=Salibacterium lacus TaxID=1898109 RepID=A0ABW5SXL3_9BACI